jgi:hypothetical protein
MTENFVVIITIFMNNKKWESSQYTGCMVKAMGRDVEAGQSLMH